MPYRTGVGGILTSSSVLTSSDWSVLFHFLSIYFLFLFFFMLLHPTNLFDYTRNTLVRGGGNEVQSTWIFIWTIKLERNVGRCDGLRLDHKKEKTHNNSGCRAVFFFIPLYSFGMPVAVAVAVVLSLLNANVAKGHCIEWNRWVAQVVVWYIQMTARCP